MGETYKDCARRLVYARAKDPLRSHLSPSTVLDDHSQSFQAHPDLLHLYSSFKEEHIDPMNILLSRFHALARLRDSLDRFAAVLASLPRNY